MSEAPSPRPLLDKLGVRPGARVAVVGEFEPAFVALLSTRTADVTHGEPAPETDVVFLRAESPAELWPLPRLRARIRPAGAIWVVSRKGRAATLRYADLLQAAVAAGLVDNKVVSFSETHSALRLVIPLVLRARPP